VNDRTRLCIRRALTGDDGVLGLERLRPPTHVAALPDEYRPYASDAAAQYFAGVIEDDSHPIWIAEVGNPRSPIWRPRFAVVQTTLLHQTLRALRASTCSSRARRRLGVGGR